MCTKPGSENAHITFESDTCHNNSLVCGVDETEDVKSCTIDKSVEEATKLCFNNLPEELQIKIFSFLSPQELCRYVAPVCHNWRWKAHDPLLWKSLTLKVSKEKDIEVCSAILMRVPLLHSLTIRAAPFRIKEFALCSTFLPQLRHLDLGFCDRLDAETVNLFVSNCSLIESLNVEGCTGIDSRAVSSIVKLPHLKILNLSHCYFVDNISIKQIGIHCRNLQKLNIDGITRITDSAVELLGEQLYSTLSHLELDGEELTDRSFESLSECSSLCALCISFAVLLTDSSLKYIKKLTNLRKLRLRRGQQLSARSLADFFVGPQMQNLVHLEMDSLNIDDCGLKNVTLCCKHLIYLSLPWCWEITDAGLEAIIHNCRMLSFLDLLGLYKITGACLLDVPTFVPNLCYLNVEQCNDIIDALLNQLVSVMPNLKILDYYGEPVIPEEP